LLCTVSGVAGRIVRATESFIEKIAKKSNAGEEQYGLLCEIYFSVTDRDVLGTKILLEKGADPLFCNGSSESALAVASWKNDIGTVKMLLKYVDQDVPISTIKSHILAAMAPSDDNHNILRWKVKPSLVIQKTLWNYYWRKVYPASE
jgi:hypothetical protein